ncbi:bifunctional tRNA (5-methylaminomethyl-2-thiouridine)(34)-methyltransferase MnmD/FAD-dependent 5-carboxymethylaminomethyl-2-thiouridine(34) oxidoreductase MnmC [Pseudomethylobacillus aquaticus]|uniref:tRNA 5-methylaminomethyl-2-thiouridine biosynthesis bifunctional protein MnmC n=1 Tax=Pseudomethylobacillus aquaticus TaxID=2676064 RepID=A0A3N0V612_9PROT|nr:bifunctional tRNA (5-methylaminomethyl-2-thiouridine)(34)-methyltransferase MnmD/FAD-dependent 5-carboxymethylaminomethyl-2-thiouridine(34) oxidoreductase MnmC [Pseudomethylobacillus aquaticus]ROH88021.1 bifunctional tRNA (5-methylaminomethyl-2-thiouridine)(34)-methyltransferase MnmD/FAD-dependent 5-carboxymethylaminomethyl-2-thiouridine(34) oxidoreductase MnmC [Pseudomethylobacillus aquaticus]
MSQSPSSPEPTQDAQLDWPDGQPYSRQFGDVYFSRDDGLNETRHVFLHHNALAERWQALQQPHFTIAETGFGTGLNFLCAWQLWRAQAPASARLHFISTERYPLSHDDLQQALALWPELHSYSQALLAQYQMLAPGWHRLQFDQGRVLLTLLIGDALTTLPGLHAGGGSCVSAGLNSSLKFGIDAWFLDGFAPSRNPDLWQAPLFAQMARLSHAGTTFATFTSAGLVKRGLSEAGFSVRKVAGFGRKREMLCGHYAATTTVHNHTPSARRAIVIGGGVSGTASAHALALRGWQVTLIERHAALAQEASGNPLGMLYPKLTGQDTPLGRLALHAYTFTLRLLQTLNLPADAHARCGLLQLAHRGTQEPEPGQDKGQQPGNGKHQARLDAIAARGLPQTLVQRVDAATASHIAGIPLQHEALYFPAAGWVDPAALCTALAAQPGISTLTCSAALALHQTADGWQLQTSTGVQLEADMVVVANANDCKAFTQTAALPLRPVRGQLSFVPATEASLALKTVLCSDGYISPARAGYHCLGATFVGYETSTEVTEADHLANLDMLQRSAPVMHAALAGKAMQGRAALRCASPDYLPLAGPMLDLAALQCKVPRHSAHPSSLPWLQGLYVNVGQGSKGLIQAPLCAEWIASHASGEPAPMDTGLLAALSPNRFALRELGLKRITQHLHDET